jgi:hypothetical protein
VKKLFFVLALGLLAVSCEAPRETGVGGSTPRKSTGDTESIDKQEHGTRRKLGRDWRGRYSEKTIRRRYGLSKKQLESVKKELRKKDPSLTTKATQNPPNTQTSPSGR